MKGCGADAVFDYRASDVVEQIVTAAGRGGVDYVYDAISEGESVRLGTRCLRKNGPKKLAFVLPLADDQVLDDTVEYFLVMVAAIFGAEVALGPYVLLVSAIILVASF